MICIDCKEDKSTDNFYKQPKGSAYRNICKSCYSARNKKYHNENYDNIKVTQKKLYEKNKPSIFEYIKSWRNQNKEKVKDYEKKSRANHADEKITWTQNRRAKIRGSQGSFTPQEWDDLCRQYNNRCLCCGRDDVKLTQDHINPIKLGGTNTIDNIQPLCQSCNSRKNAKHIDYRKEKS